MRVAPALMFSALLATGANAADYLRGPISAEPVRPAQSASMDWSGFYVGAQAVYNNAYVDQTSLGPRTGAAGFPNLGVNSVAGELLRFGKPHVGGGGFGGFAGYNTQWDDVILGLEVDYNSAGFTASTVSPSLTRALRDPTNTTTNARFWDTTLGGTARTTVRDVTAFKVRVGASYDRFLPYLAGGFVVGRASSRSTVLGTTQQYEMQPILDPVTSQVIGYNRINLSGVIPANASLKDEGWRWGYTVGAGMDVALTENIFLRGAWDYTQFGTGSVRTGIHGFKGGAGVKF